MNFQYLSIRYGPETNYAQTDGQTETDRRTGMVNPIYFSNFAWGGIIRLHIIYYVMFIKYI